MDFDINFDIDLDVPESAHTFFHKEKFSKAFIKKLRIEDLKKQMPGLPKRNEVLHILTEGEFNSITIICMILESISGKVNFAASMLGMNQQSFLKLMEYYDNEKISSIDLICDKDIMNIRHDGVQEMIEAKAKTINLRFASVRNHTKITLIENGIEYYVIISSANYLTNIQYEQYAIFNSKSLHEFYKSWFEKHLNGK